MSNLASTAHTSSPSLLQRICHVFTGEHREPYVLIASLMSGLQSTFITFSDVKNSYCDDFTILPILAVLLANLMVAAWCINEDQFSRKTDEKLYLRAVKHLALLTGGKLVANVSLLYACLVGCSFAFPASLLVGLTLIDSLLCLCFGVAAVRELVKSRTLAQ